MPDTPKKQWTVEQFCYLLYGASELNVPSEAEVSRTMRCSCAILFVDSIRPPLYHYSKLAVDRIHGYFNNDVQSTDRCFALRGCMCDAVQDYVGRATTDNEKIACLALIALSDKDWELLCRRMIKILDELPKGEIPEMGLGLFSKDKTPPAVDTALAITSRFD